MKNHWIQLYEKKNKKIWTIEFSKKGFYHLKPRRVEVIEPQYSLSLLGQNKGMVSLAFKDAMLAINDHELMNFLADVHRNKLKNFMARLRMYQGLKEVENYELTDLTYQSLTNLSIDDIKFTFDFNHVRFFQVS